MDRDEQIKQLFQAKEPFDLIVIGGGATGLGVALDASSRGYRVALIEAHDFASATSSKSTKLVHGGVRYLQQFDFALVSESMSERRILLKMAPSYVWEKRFVLPVQSLFQRLFYGFGLKVYDFFAGKKNLTRSKYISKRALSRLMPQLNTERIIGGIEYSDAQFNDSEFAAALAQKITQMGGVVVNYVQVEELIKEKGKVVGVKVFDTVGKSKRQVMAKGVVNATGIFTDSIRKFDNPSEKKLLALSRGSHLIIDKKFFPGKMALIDPKTEDGRVFFIIPWLDSVIIGTTDEFTPAPRYDSHPREREIRFLLKHANKHLAGKVQPSDIKALYSGIRPLVKLESKRNSTAKISRRHSLTRSKSNLITVTGGKWGIFRKMGEEAVDMAIDTFDLEKRKSRSKNLTIPPKPDRLEEEKFLHPDLAYTKSDIEYAVQEQMAVTLEDVLARRTRCLFLNHQATMAIAPSVCQMMAEMMGKNEHWVKDQLMQFTQVAESYKV